MTGECDISHTSLTSTRKSAQLIHFHLKLSAKQSKTAFLTLTLKTNLCKLSGQTFLLPEP